MEGRIATLEANYVHMASDLKDAKTDIKDVRDRMTRLEVNVSHLPSKGFIVTVVGIAITILVGFCTLVPKLQQLLGIIPTPQ